MRFLSVCSGIEAASVAWSSWEAVAFSEIEAFPSAVLTHRYPHVPNLGDMTKFMEWNVGTVDLVVGGTPCQSFSVAGLRKGLADPRGNLALVYCGILDRFKPQWFVWENVPGVLSSGGGRDFGSFLGALAELGYGFAYRVLDAQYFGVAQRRRRVFVVGYFGDWRPAAAVLFEFDGVRRDTAPSREAGQEVAGTFTARANSGGWGQDPNLAASGYMRVAPTVTSGAPFSRTGNGSEVEALQLYTVANCLTARMHKGINSTLDEGQTPIMHSVGVTLHGTHGTASVASFTDLSSTLRSRIPSGVENSTTTAVLQPIGFNARQDPDSWADRTGPLDTDGSTQAIMTGGTGRETPVAFTQNKRNEVRTVKVAGALAAEPGMKQQTYLNQSMQVRRLTPVECERLQGFPDGYTNIPWRGKPESPDGPRYKALGNSMAVPVMRWIGAQIDVVDKLMRK